LSFAFLNFLQDFSQSCSVLLQQTVWHEEVVLRPKRGEAPCRWKWICLDCCSCATKLQSVWIPF
jgi:hypothetical protein